ncbi:MAG: ABC transporter permease, partial [Bacteroidales bacterium]|nr:ABC transporter permease [Bacteroidales bacterium]
SIVLTESLANKYFPDDDPIGQLIRIPGFEEVKVSGIMKDPPRKNSQPFSMIAPLDLFSNELTNLDYRDWGVTMTGIENWIMLAEGVDPDHVERQLAELVGKHAPEGYSDYVRFELQPLKEIHLAPDFQNNSGTYTTEKNDLVLVGVIGLLILIIGSINFINLSNAQGMRRMKEVGVRKVLGANRSMVSRQFLAETYLMVLAAIVIAIIMAEIFLPLVNDFYGNLLELSIYESGFFVPFVLILFLLIGLMSGFYPSMFLSRFKPVETLKNNYRAAGNFSTYLRNGLLLIQFVITVGLLVSVFVINSQMKYIQAKDLGFRKENIVVFSIPDPEKENIDKVSGILKNNPNVEQFSFSFGAPTSSSNMGSNYSSPEADVDDELNLNLKIVDTAYLHIYGLELLAGEWLLRKSKEDSLYRLVVNEKLVNTLGVKDPVEAIGMRLRVSGIEGRIEGVVKNFHTASLKSEYSPVAFVYLPNYFYEVNVHIAHNYSQTIQRINDELATVFPDYVINYYTVEESISNLYERDRKTLTLLKFFSVIALFIAMMGLFGLVSFYMVQKTREIGIRKVLGASISGLFVLLTRWQFVLLLIATVIGGIVSWYYTSKWLDSFSYRIDYPLWVFPLIFMLLMVVNFITIFFHVQKTARANPVEAIKYE